MSQKIENQLNLALSITEEERQKSESLDIGYDLEEKEWELIVKYSGTLERVRTDLQGTIAILLYWVEQGHTPIGVIGHGAVLGHLPLLGL